MARAEIWRDGAFVTGCEVRKDLSGATYVQAMDEPIENGVYEIRHGDAVELATFNIGKWGGGELRHGDYLITIRHDQGGFIAWVRHDNGRTLCSHLSMAAEISTNHYEAPEQAIAAATTGIDSGEISAQ